MRAGSAVLAVALFAASSASAAPRRHHHHKHVAQTKVAEADPPPISEAAPSPETVAPQEAPPPAFMPNSQPAAPPSDTVEVRHRRYGLMSGGLVLFAAGYAADAAVSYGFHHATASTSLIPLIGPLIQCGEHYGYSGPMVATGNADFDTQTNAQIAEASRLIAGVTYFGLALDFAGQLAGLVMAVVGAVSHTSEHVPARAGQLALVPSASGASTLVVRF